MSRIRLLVITLVGIIVLINSYYFYITYSQQVDFQKDLLIKQVEICASEIETTASNFENELNFIIFSNNVLSIYKKENNHDILSKFQIFYSKYSDLITSLNIYDYNNNVFSLYKDKKEVFITDYYSSQRQRKLVSKELYENNNEGFTLIVPIFNQNIVTANIYIGLDYKKSILNRFNKYYLNNVLNQWIIDENGKFIGFNIKSDSIVIENYNVINNFITIGKEGYLNHKIKYKNITQTYLSVYYPINILNRQLGIVFSLAIDKVISSVIYKFIATTLLILLVIGLMLYVVKMLLNKTRLEQQNSIESEIAFRQIVELLPVGIIIIDSTRKVRNINIAAQRILLLDENENIVGNDISNRFFLGKTLLIQHNEYEAFEASHFLHYEKDGKEVVIYKTDIPIKLKGEELLVQSFIDVSPLERSRKREIAANMAKSEFLARMSHEIRTPMNGIIGMADALAEQKFNAEQIEQINVIRRSADMLMTILNDILDLSKIEAGKMALEEIPFKLREEVNMSVDLFKYSAEEKNIKIISRISQNVKDFYIGDPFRIRQILNNLIGNAIKFTNEGVISVTVKTAEEYNKNVTLLFEVEDTGIGIAKEKLTQIFESFSQADNSTTRKYGGTGLGTAISKQLVELMNGEIWVESPSTISNNPKYPGTKFSFTIELFLNERIPKNIDFNNITSLNNIKALIIGESKHEEEQIHDTLKKFGLQVELQQYQKSTVELLKYNAQHNNINRPTLIIIKDSATFDSFKLVNKISEADINNYYIIVIATTNNKHGNYSKSRRLGVDYYLIYPFDTSELYNIIIESYPNIKFEENTTTNVTQIKKNLQILVAEDNPINQKVAKTIFKNIGFEIDFARNGIEVLSMVEQKNYDIIFMDVMMPEKDGLETTIDLKKMNNNIPIVAMTANINAADKVKALSIGMHDYITKPVKVDIVKKILLRLFSEEVSV